MTDKPSVTAAYFSMEIMLETDIPTYAGGLGVLAGDILRSCADMQIPAIGVSLVYSGPIMGQKIRHDGTQSFKEIEWQKLDQLTKLPDEIEIEIAGNSITVSCWRYDIVGINEFVVPVYLLDIDNLANQNWVRQFGQDLYDSHPDARIIQEMVLGFGGVKMLARLGYSDIRHYHLNEGHCSFVPVALMRDQRLSLDQVRTKCVFTSHTPLAEGHDKFPYDYASKFLGRYLPSDITDLATPAQLSMTHLGLNTSRVHLAVSRKHAAVSQHLFPGYKFTPVTNGVHLRSWISSPLQDLLNHYLPGWLYDPSVLHKAVSEIDADALSQVHQEAKRVLIDHVNQHLRSRRTGSIPATDVFDPDTLTIALARRLVEYKRPLLIYRDLEELERIASGQIQIIHCGRSYPTDTTSQNFVVQLNEVSRRLQGKIRVVYLENYSPQIARLLVSGSDIWLNTPRRPLEASGTSGMKAAANGVLNFSILDGWWIEAAAKDTLSGFSIGGLDNSLEPANNDSDDAAALYRTLGTEIIPLFYQHHSQWLERMKHAISLTAYFNTHRVVKDYLSLAWL